MAGRDLSGMDELLKLFDTLPELAEEELKEDLPKIGSEVLSLQQAEVPVLSGQLRRALNVQVLGGGLKVRIGLTGFLAQSKASLRKAKRLGTDLYSYGSAFYGRIIEFGRAGGPVQVYRRRRVNGRLRSVRRRKLQADLEATYTMNVPAMAPHPFISTPETEAAALDGGEALAAFWDNVLARAGAA